MLATYVPPRLYKYSKLEAAEAYWQACLDVGLVATVDFVSVLLAHGALESGNYQRGCWNNNPGNIKADPQFGGSYTCITLNEILLDKKTGKNVERWFAPEGELTGNPRKGGKLKAAPLPVPPGHPQTRMCSFETLDDGVEFKYRFFMRPKYAAVLEPARRGDAGGFVRAIRRKGYFTAYKGIPLDQVTPYETEVIGLVPTYRPFVVEASALAAARGRHAPAAPQITDFDRARNEAMRFDLHALLRGFDGDGPGGVA